MKSKILVTLFVLITCTINAQEGCTVHMPEINGEYTGACKKGLAHGNGKSVGTDTYEGQFKKGWPHGKGTYTYESGDHYIGDMRFGKLDGEGEMHIISAGTDTLISGVWVDNNYVGPKIEKPKVIMKVNVDDGRFKRNGNGNRLIIGIFQNGKPNREITQLTIASNSGGRYDMGSKIVLDNLVFPFECKISYVTWNKMHTAQFQASFQFEIQQAGEWTLDISN